MTMCPTLPRISLIAVVKNVAEVLTTMTNRPVLGVNLQSGDTWYIRNMFVAITAVVRTSVDIGAGFLTVLGS